MDPDSKNGSTNEAEHELNSRKPKKPKPTYITQSEIAAEFSHHDRSFTRINNGSFGCCPKSILAVQSQIQLHFLSQPDDYYINHLQPSLLKSRCLIKDLVNADHVDEISIVDNATTAAAIVLQKVAWMFTENVFNKGDAVLILHYAYGNVKKSMEAYVGRAGGHIIEVHLPFPVSSNEEIVAEFRKALDLGREGGRRVRLAVIDHTTSMPHMIIPVKELIRMCRDEGVDQVFVDAAHAIGSIDIDVKDIGADFYVSNLHKWFFFPPTAAFLYARKSAVSDGLHHPIVSSQYGKGLAIESGAVGTRDYSTMLVVPAVFEFVNRFEGGLAGIRKRNHEKVVEMGRMLAESWGTCLGTPESMCCGMIMVGLPSCLRIDSDVDALKFRTYLRNKLKIEVPIWFNSLRDVNVKGMNGVSSLVTAYARISHQVYNVEDEYYRFRDIINKFVEDGFHCGMLSSS